MKIKKLITKLKYYAYELNKNKQIPSYLFHLICHINSETSEKEVRFLKEVTESAMRIKGYYQRYPDMEHSVSKEIENLYLEFRKREIN